MHTHNLVCFLEKERQAPHWQGSSALRSQAQTSKAQEPLCKSHQGASHGGSEKPGKLEVGGASRDSTGLGALEEGLISS